MPDGGLFDDLENFLDEGAIHGDPAGRNGFAEGALEDVVTGPGGRRRRASRLRSRGNCISASKWAAP